MSVDQSLLLHTHSSAANEPPRSADAEFPPETPRQFLTRWLLGIAFACHPKRAADVPYLLCHMARDMARGGTVIPDQSRVAKRPDLFGGVCRSISPETILAAARLGFFAWCHCGPLKWWTRSKRMVLKFENHHISKNERRDMRRGIYRVTFDRAFSDVIKACAGRRSYNSHSLTWITPQIMRLYSALHRQGHAHSFEVWNADNELIGGGYGLSVGRVFITESQFSHAKNTSKIGFACLNYHLNKWGYVLNDGKDYTPTIEAMGFAPIPRAEFEAILREQAQDGGRIGPWSVEDDLATVAAWRSATELAQREK